MFQAQQMLAIHVQLFDQRALEALHKMQNAGFNSWFVGGCVRDALLGKPFSDYDLVTVAKPEVIIEILKNHLIDLKGKDFGCIRVNINSLWLEITTLREDVNQNGRHTDVVFTTDLAKDAARRDFTINAMYWDGQENSPIIDSFNGQADLRSQTVRFIDNAEIKVQEDYLRILRFFRFNASYGKDVDSIGMAACTKHQQGLQYLSGTRVWIEWSKMLLQPNTETVLSVIIDTGIDLTLFGSALNENVASIYQGNDRLLFTKLLFPSVSVQHLAHRLNLSNAQTSWLKVADSLSQDQGFRELYLEYGLTAQELVYYWAAKFNESVDTELSKPFWQISSPTFPIKGKDLLKLGCLPGPIVGSYLKRTQNWWVQNNFMPSQKECLTYVRSLFKP
jgi:poly(A) polymerase